MSNHSNMTTLDAARVYETSKIEGATPGNLLLQVYDYTIAACRNGKEKEARNGLIELSGALNLDYTDVAGPLFRIYDYCGERVRENEYEEPARILSALRETWTQVVCEVERIADNTETSV